MNNNFTFSNHLCLRLFACVCAWFPNFLHSHYCFLLSSSHLVRLLPGPHIHTRTHTKLDLHFIYLSVQFNGNWILIIAKENRQIPHTCKHLYTNLHTHFYAPVTFLLAYIFIINAHLVGSSETRTLRHICDAILNRIFSFLIVVIVLVFVLNWFSFIDYCVLWCRIFVSIQYYVMPNMKLKKCTVY